mmetsp:Transcript_38991/g.59301  ORF Transcript_38991/g.59301 Transcript_38991/m.59301 type:complete len:152 (+) Transcript_38991:3807-4262(+)
MDREDQTMPIEQFFMDSQKLMKMMREYWNTASKKRGHQPNLQTIFDNKMVMAETHSLKILVGFKKIEDQLQEIGNDLSSKKFLITVSRLFTYMFDLENMVQQRTLTGVTFYHFVESGALEQVLRVGNLLKAMKIKSRLEHEDKDNRMKFIA